MFDLWQSIAKKLDITEDACALLYAFNRQWVNKWGQRKTYVIVGDIVERFGLDDRPTAESYARQLFARGVLTTSEAALFAGDYNGINNQAAQGQTQEESATASDAGADSAGAGSPAPLDLDGKA